MTNSTLIPISTTAAAPVAGPYSQAIKTPSLIFVSGQIPAEPSGAVVTGSIAAQTAACCENIKAILAEAGSDITRVVKTTVFLTDMANFAEMNEIFGQYFTQKPSRSTVEVKGLPKGVPVEIEAIALV